MTPRVSDLISVLEEMAPSSLAESWDNPGLQVGSHSQEIQKLCFALDPTLNAVRNAHHCGAQVLVTHHPLIFSPLKQLNMGTYPGNVIVEAVHNGVSVIAVHTNLDVAKGGINDILVDLLGLRQAEVLKEVDGVHGVGLGRIGYLSEPAGVTGVLEKVKQILGTQRPKLVGAEDARVHRVAVVGGAGGSLVPLAFRREADLLLTGDVTHHQALEAQLLGLAVIDAGHYYTERTAFEVFAERLGQTLKGRGWKVETAMDGEEGDPLKDMGMQDGSPG